MSKEWNNGTKWDWSKWRFVKLVSNEISPSKLGSSEKIPRFIDLSKVGQSEVLAKQMGLSEMSLSGFGSTWD